MAMHHSLTIVDLPFGELTVEDNADVLRSFDTLRLISLVCYSDAAHRISFYLCDPIWKAYNFQFHQ